MCAGIFTLSCNSVILASWHVVKLLLVTPNELARAQPNHEQLHLITNYTASVAPTFYHATESVDSVRATRVTT